MLSCVTVCLKPSSITLVRNWFKAGSKLVAD